MSEVVSEPPTPKAPVIPQGGEPAEAEPISYWLTRFTILRLIGFVYLFAFLALARQVLPLIGSEGLLPVEPYLERVEAHFGSAWAGFEALPSLFWLQVSDASLVWLAWLGVALSLVVVAGYANSILMASLWLLYGSFVRVGQDWYGYGWEIQLLETGFLAIFLCPLLDARPFPRRAPPPPVIWLFRWLIFRIMLGAGAIKIRGDACWRDLSCLDYFYETQPIPNPLSPWFHFLPSFVHRIGVAFNHLVELGAPWLVFGPRTARLLAGLAMFGFQALLILGGNLSFLNYLTIVPILACFDDAFLRRVLPATLVARSDRARHEAEPSAWQNRAAWVLVSLVAVLSVNPVANLVSRDQIMNTSFDALALVNTYGAFGSVGRERYEIVFEGTNDDWWEPDAAWREYEFPCKPGNPNRRPCVVSPYQPRLAWQLWFAAMSTPERYPWTLHLVDGLLTGDPAALALVETNPFSDGPPRFVRAELYRYRFASEDDRAWWRRERSSAWIPPLSEDDPRLQDFLRAYGWIETPGRSNE